MNTLIKPSVGRKVWYRPAAYDLLGPGAMSVGHDSTHPTKRQPLDATVLAVHSDRCINVLVLDVYGKPFTKTSVTLKQVGDEMPKDAEGQELGGYVEWMPYQAEQAAKQAQAESAS